MKKKNRAAAPKTSKLKNKELDIDDYSADYGDRVKTLKAGLAGWPIGTFLKVEDASSQFFWVKSSNKKEFAWHPFDQKSLKNGTFELIKTNKKLLKQINTDTYHKIEGVDTFKKTEVKSGDFVQILPKDGKAAGCILEVDRVFRDFLDCNIENINFTLSFSKYDLTDGKIAIIKKADAKRRGLKETSDKELIEKFDLTNKIKLNQYFQAENRNDILEDMEEYTDDIPEFDFSKAKKVGPAMKTNKKDFNSPSTDNGYKPGSVVIGDEVQVLLDYAHDCKVAAGRILGVIGTGNDGFVTKTFYDNTIQEFPYEALTDGSLKIVHSVRQKSDNDIENNQTQGVRHNQDKLRWRNFPMYLVEPLIEVGASAELREGNPKGKYPTLNFLKGLKVQDTLDSMKRHMAKLDNPRESDYDESGCHHLAHIAWNALVALETIINKPEFDDREK